MCSVCKQPFNQQRGVNRHHWYHILNPAVSAQIQYAVNAAVKR